MPGNSKSFTVIDLLVGVCVAILLIAAFVPAAGILDAANARAGCAKNLKLIGAALITYGNNNNGKYATVVWDPKHYDNVTAYTFPQDKDPFSKESAIRTDVTAAIFLLFRDIGGLKPQDCVCPGTNAVPIKFGFIKRDSGRIPDLSNFSSEQNLSYSMDNPYHAGKTPTNGNWLWDMTLGEDYPLFADMNPGGKAVLTVTANSKPEDLRKANSRNHGGEGQNVLYGDYHVAFQTTPFCGPFDEDKKTRDNIYTRSNLAGAKRDKKVELKGDPIWGPCTDDWDAVLLPTAGYKPDAKGEKTKDSK